MTLTTLTRTILAVRHANRVLTWQEARIRELEATVKRLQNENDELVLAHGREMHGLICAWLIHCDQPEKDMRHELSEFANNLGNQIARLEEHVL